MTAGKKWSSVLAATWASGGKLGYWFAAYRSFRENRHATYMEGLPVIIKFALDPEPEDQEGFNRALAAF